MQGDDQYTHRTQHLEKSIDLCAHRGRTGGDGGGEQRGAEGSRGEGGG